MSRINNHFPSGGTLQADKLVIPRVEVEFVYKLKEPLTKRNITKEDVLNATEFIVCARELIDNRADMDGLKVFDSIADNAAFEIIDSRFQNFKFGLCGGVIDNISVKRLKLGGQKFDPKKIDLVTIGVTISVNGEDRIFGASGAVLGHPARAVAAYANLLAETGRYIKAGDVVLSGAITAATPVKQGDIVRSEFLDMGFVELHVV